MKKMIAVLLAMLMLLSCAACSSNKPKDGKQAEPNQTENQTTSDTNKTTETDNNELTPAQIEAAIAKALGDGYLCTEDVPEDEFFLSPLVFQDMEKIDEYVAKITAVPSLNLDSVTIVHCKDGSADDVVAHFNESFAQSISYIRQYHFGVAKVEGARLYQVGNTVMYIIAGAAPDENMNEEEEAKLAASEYEKIDNVIKELFGYLPDNLTVMPTE